MYAAKSSPDAIRRIWSPTCKLFTKNSLPNSRRKETQLKSSRAAAARVGKSASPATTPQITAYMSQRERDTSRSTRSVQNTRACSSQNGGGDGDAIDICQFWIIPSLLPSPRPKIYCTRLETGLNSPWNAEYSWNWIRAIFRSADYDDDLCLICMFLCLRINLCWVLGWGWRLFRILLHSVCLVFQKL